jgi:hypothetical protein
MIPAGNRISVKAPYLVRQDDCGACSIIGDEYAGNLHQVIE